MKKGIKIFFLKIVNFVWQRFAISNRPIKKTPKKILLVYPSGIGNSILCNGALNSLKKAYTEVDLYAAHVCPPTYESLRAIGGFRDIFQYNDKSTIKENWKFFLKVKRLKIDTAMIFYPNCGYVFNLLLLLAGVKNRIGFELPDRPTFFSALFLSHAKVFSSGCSEFENCLSLVDCLQIKRVFSSFFQVASRSVSRISIGKELKVGIHVGCKNPQKPGWDTVNFIELCRIICEKYKAKIYLYGGKDECEIGRTFESSLRDNVVNLTGVLSLEETFWGISKMNIFVSNDTGLMHVAASQNIPLVAIFGPTDRVKCMPFMQDKDRLRLVFKECDCQPCYFFGVDFVCKENLICLSNIFVSDIVDVFSEFINSFKGSLNEY